MADKAKKALIIGASGGIGTALARLCEYQGYVVKTLSRRVDGLDITNEESVKAAAKNISGGLDLIVIATGALEVDGHKPERTIQSMTAESLTKHFETNALGPALLLKHFTQKLTKTRRSIVVVMSARIGSIGDNSLGGWVSFRTSKAALNQIVRTTAIELERKKPNAICIAYHPGTVETNLSHKYLKNRQSVSAHDAAHDLMTVMDKLTVLDTGHFIDWAGKPIEW
jgi:NAD(P)-dependent dehydrogenase (short-subunit alcohol dehydrogenase family)